MHVFALLGDPVRRRIVELLAKHERPVWRLVEIVGPEFSIGQPAISHQLRVLRDAGFVEFRPWGLQRHYRLTFDAMDRLDAAVEQLFVIWEDRTGWPYDPFLLPPTHKLDRAGRAGLRGRTQRQIEPDLDPFAPDESPWDELLAGEEEPGEEEDPPGSGSIPGHI